MKLSLRMKMIAVSALLVVVPIALVGGYAIFASQSFGNWVETETYAGLVEQAKGILRAGVETEKERVDAQIVRSERLLHQLADSASTQRYLSSKAGQNQVLNDFITRQIERITEGLVSTCEAYRLSGAESGGPEHFGPFRKIKIGTDGYVFVIDSQRNTIFHPREDLIGKNVITDLGLSVFRQVIKDRNDQEVNTQNYDFEGRRKFVSYVHYPQWDWIIGASAYWDDLSPTAAQASLATLREEFLFSSVLDFG